MQITTIGIDLAKNSFQVHGVDTNGKAVLKRKLRRAEMTSFFANLAPCVVGMEACAGAHYWARELGKAGHTVRLMAPQYVKPYVKTNKNDRADAEAICEAVQRPTMRFVPVKTEAQQGVLMLHRAREVLVRQRTQLVNALRGHLAEFGVIAPQSIAKVRELVAVVADPEDKRIPPIVRETLQTLVDQMADTDRRITALETRMVAAAKADETCKRLMTIPGIGPIIASALAAMVGNAANFTSGRHLAAWLGLVARQNSTGGKERLGPISKRGDSYMRQLLIHGARAVMRWRKDRDPWLQTLLAKRPYNVAVVALANKTARIAWAVLHNGGTYRPPGATTQPRAA